MMEIIKIMPKGKEIELSEEVRYYMLLQVPKGRLTRDQDIREYLGKLYGASYIDFITPLRMRPIFDYDKYINRILDNVPFHREVSSLGYTYNPEYIKKLKEEGFVILPKSGNRTERVEDYKKYLFDFEKESSVDLSVLEKISKEGIETYLK